MNKNILRIILITLSVVLLRCSALSPDLPQGVHEVVTEFTIAWEESRFVDAYALLTQDIISRVSYEQFSNNTSSYKGIAELLKNSGISPAGYTIDIEVTEANGRNSTISFIAVKEKKDWKIANIEYVAP